MFFQNYDDRKNTTSLKTIKIQMVLDMFLPGSNTGRVSATTKEKDLTRMEKKPTPRLLL